MSSPTEHKTVQARILAYAEAIGWTVVSREEAERRRGFEPQMAQMSADDPSVNHLRESAKSAVKNLSDGKGLSLFFDDLLDAKVREFNPRYAEAEGALLGRFPPSLRLSRTGRHLHTDIYGNPPLPTSYGGTGREFVVHLRNWGKFFDHGKKRERDLTGLVERQVVHD